MLLPGKEKYFKMQGLKILSDDIVKNLELVLTNKTCMDSLVHGLVFYETRITGIFLTNFDIARELDHNIHPDLTKKDLWCVFYRSARLCFTYISSAVLLEKVFFDAVLIELQKNKTGQRVMGLPVTQN